MATVTGYAALQRRFAAISSPEGNVATMRLLGTAAVREQKLLVHRRTGNTGRTIHVASVSENRVVTAAGGAAVFLEEGTRPHTITAKAAKALRWAASRGGATLGGGIKAGAAVRFSKVVHHPGTKPYPFMVPGAVKAAQSAGLTDDIVKRWNEAA